MGDITQTVTIYTLADPRDGSVRYVGKTINVEARAHGHFYENHHKTRSHKANWIKSLKDLGLKPVLEVLEKTTESEWQETERFWIEYLRQLGFNLTNLTIGGDGISRMLPEVREKIRAMKLGTKDSPETIAKKRAASIRNAKSTADKNRGRKQPAEEIAKRALSNTGKKRTPETRAKMSAWQIGRKMSSEAVEKSRQANLGKKLSPESIAKRTAARAGYRHSDETREKMRAAAIKRYEVAA